MTSVKTSKDKPCVTSPRITSRPTAASVARAARNAANRSLTLNNNQRQSPIRSLPSPTTSKIKTAVSRSGPKTDSKTEVKINRNFENEASVLDIDVPTNRDSEAYYPSPENLHSLDNVRDGTTFSSAGDTNNIQDIMIFADSGDLENISIIQERESAITDYIQTSQVPTMSRPQTPKSISSRPQTPRVPSRPSTPAHPLQRHSTPISRPSTPQQVNISNMTRPKTPSTPISLNTKPTTPIATNNSPHIIKNHEKLKSLYINKQKEFLQLKKELDLKQRTVLEVYDSVRNLRERAISEGLSVESDGQQELALLDVADWAVQEINQLCHQDEISSDMNSALEIFNIAVPIDECKLTDIETHALKVPAYFAELCLQAFTARQDLIDWVKDLIDNNEIVSNDAAERIAQYNSQGLELYEALHEFKTQADNAVDDITKHARRMCKERSSLLTVGESLVREIAQLRQELQSRSDATNKIKENSPDPEFIKELEHTRQLLDEERKSKTTMKDKLAATEAQLRQARLRISKMDRQLREAEASITSLTGTVKTLEDQSRQRESQLEARARKLKETVKTGEINNSQLTNQRESLKNEIKNLKEQLQTITTKYKSEEQMWSNKLNDLTSALDNEKSLTKAEMEQKQKLEAALKESQNILQKLKAKVSSLEHNGPNSDLPTEREMDMWAELQATKDTLRATEEEINACKNEKVRFLETLTKIAESDSKSGIQQKLAAELSAKEEILGKIQMQVRELSKSNKLYEQKIIQYEQYFRDLQANLNIEANCDDPNNLSNEHLQQEITKLRISLLDALHRKEELVENLTEKEQQLERQDKTSRAQAKVIKVREELINMLKNKETEQSKKLVALQQDLEHRMKIVDEVNKQIGAKADEIQELFTTLENKQQQIHRLEKIVFALEEQQTRSQAQRTRQEEKIAALEHELAAGNRRERKFLFF